MIDPYTAAEEALVADVNAGRIDDREFHREMRALRDEVRAEAEEAADAAYDEVMRR